MKTSAPALLPLFRSETQLRVVALLFGGEAELQVRDVAEAVAVPGPTASRELARLERHGLVRSRVLGRSRLYAANWDLPWAKELASIIAQTVGVLAALSRALAAVDGVEEACVFGSWAARYKGEPGPWPRDVDVAIIGDPDQLALMRGARDAEAGLRIDVNTTVIDRETWDDPEPGSFTSQVKTGPLVRVPIGDAAPIVDDVATRPLRLDPDLQAAVDDARRTLAASGRLRPKRGHYRPTLDEQERAAVARMVSGGTYRRLADAVAEDDPDIADQ